MSKGIGKEIKIGILGLDHRHIYGMLKGMLETGATLVSCWCDDNESPVVPGFKKRFPYAQFVSTANAVVEDPKINLVLIAAVPYLRAELAVKAMHSGKDVLVDKPGCVNKVQLDNISTAIKETGRIWAIDFSERFEVPASVYALDLVKSGAIGTIVL